MTDTFHDQRIERKRIEVTGVVQGVGFRPFVYQLMPSLGIGGFFLIPAQGRD
jgi:acylphosphatase